MKNLANLKGKKLGLAMLAVAIAVGIPAVALSDTYDSVNSAPIQRIRDRGSSSLGFVDLVGSGSQATELYYFGATGTCASVPDSALTEDQINRLVQAQVHGMVLTAFYETGSWGGYKCLTGFDIETP